MVVDGELLCPLIENLAVFPRGQMLDTSQRALCLDHTPGGRSTLSKGRSASAPTVNPGLALLWLRGFFKLPQCSMGYVPISCAYYNA